MSNMTEVKQSESKYVKTKTIQSYEGLTNSILFLLNQQSATPTSLKCICGGLMETVNDSRILYYGFGATCDVCRVFGRKNETYHHCEDWNNYKHPHGFDVCDQCAVMLFESMNAMCRSPDRCFFVLQLLGVMKQKYMDHIHENVSIIDNFLHILEKHNDDISYEWISDRLNECKLANCSSFAAIYSTDPTAKPTITAKQQIFHKIHCYFQHGFDGGLRLRLREKKLLRVNDCNNSSFFKRRQKLIDKRNVFKSEINRFKQCNRFSQLHPVEHESKQQNDNINIQKAFNLGIMFEYGYDGEHFFLSKNINRVQVKKKHDSLKEELIDNKISALTQQQYVNEYEKAIINLNSSFCKRYYSEPVIPSSSLDSRNKDISYKPVAFSIDHILSLMVYCNCDQLQYLFSKTYRENDGRDHSHFFHLGMNLKIAVKLFGTAISDGPIKQFYHGISEQLFINPFNNPSQNLSISVRCPLSTTSSFEVAVNFTGDLEGMIIEFSKWGDAGKIKTKSFSCEWLSDYANEKEHLFIQNSFLENLTISNITIMSDSIEYKQIIKALDVIQSAIYSAVRNLGVGDITESMKELILCILHDRLSTTFKRYKTFNLSDYARDMIRVYFESKTDVTIYPALLQGHIALMNRRLSFLFDIFVDGESEKNGCVRLDHIVAIFPNTVFVDILDVPLSDNFMIRLFQYLTDKSVKKALDMLRIIPSKNGWTASETVIRYSDGFKNIGYKLIMRKRKQRHAHTIFTVADEDELEIVKPSCKFQISRTCTGASSIVYK